ncbi:unnamed protein product [Aphanomyces euteiches]
MASDRQGYWGPVTSTIDWCEPNYVASFYIAEFWNAWSNIFFVLAGFYGLYRSIALGFEWRFHLIYINIVVIGIGSAMFHGTLLFVSQQFDETPMIWSMLIWFYILYSPLWEKQSASVNSFIVLLLSTLGLGFAGLHAIYRFTTGFQLLFAALVLFCLPRLFWYYGGVKNARARSLVGLYLGSILIATACWLVDFHYCQSAFNFYGHAWWHCFMSLNAYAGPLFMQYVRADSKGKNPTVEVAWPTTLTISIASDKQD